MKRQVTESKERAFAVVITLVLLSLLVGIALAISATFRSNSDLSESKKYQVRARQNALLALKSGMARLQIAAGPDERVTGMAGITGIESHRNNSTRHWCGIWTTNGVFLEWITSGAKNNGPVELEGDVQSIELWGQKSMGSPAADSERVIAGKLSLGGSGNSYAHYAYAVIDEGVKIPVYVPDPILDEQPQIFSRHETTLGDVRSRLRDAVLNNAPQIEVMTSYEQLGLLDNVTSSTLHDNLHHVTFESRYPEGEQLRSGKMNINTNSKRVWQGLVQTYNLQVAADEQISNDQIRLRGEDLGEFAAEFEEVGMKSRLGPFLDIDAVGPFLLTEFDGDDEEATGADIMNVLRPMLTTRSDTFRIRAYGDAMNPADVNDSTATPESVAYCEAIVQRTNEPGPNGVGKKFVITYFRWLGPDDI